MSDLYVDNATTPPWVKVYLDKATLPEVAAGLLRLLRCDTCGGSGKVRPESASPHFDMGYREPCPAPDCVNGIRLPEKMVEAMADRLMEGYGVHRHPDYGGSALEKWEIMNMLRWSLPAGLAALKAEK